MSRIGLFVFAALASVAIAQGTPKPTVAVSRLSPPIYPRLALQARIATAVVLDVTVRPDGSVDSVVLFSGHPMLNAAAIESAKKTVFECMGCGESSTSYRMTYQFELGDPLSCKGIDANGYGIYDVGPETEVSQSREVITVRGRSYTTCDPAERISYIKFRSAKCLYLWHCGRRSE